MDSQRQQKISKLLQRELGEILRREGKNHFGGALITVTKVTVTRDLSIARVYLSLFAPGTSKINIDDIRGQSREIRYTLGTLIKNQVRHIPELEFYVDDSLDYIEHIEDLLKDE
jgi:ribosome-binding factor A